MKEFCDVCDGKGYVFEAEFEDDEYMGDDMFDCKKCNGKGYTENTELERLAEIGRATEKAFN